MEQNNSVYKDRSLGEIQNLFGPSDKAHDKSGFSTQQLVNVELGSEYVKELNDNKKKIVDKIVNMVKATVEQVLANEKLQFKITEEFIPKVNEAIKKQLQGMNLDLGLQNTNFVHKGDFNDKFFKEEHINEVDKIRTKIESILDKAIEDRQKQCDEIFQGDDATIDVFGSQTQFKKKTIKTTDLKDVFILYNKDIGRLIASEGKVYYKGKEVQGLNFDETNNIFSTITEAAVGAKSVFDNDIVEDKVILSSEIINIFKNPLNNKEIFIGEISPEQKETLEVAKKELEAFTNEATTKQQQIKRNLEEIEGNDRALASLQEALRKQQQFTESSINGENQKLAEVTKQIVDINGNHTRVLEIQDGVKLIRNPAVDGTEVKKTLTINGENVDVILQKPVDVANDNVTTGQRYEDIIKATREQQKIRDQKIKEAEDEAKKDIETPGGWSGNNGRINGDFSYKESFDAYKIIYKKGILENFKELYKLRQEIHYDRSKGQDILRKIKSKMIETVNAAKIVLLFKSVEGSLKNPPMRTEYTKDTTVLENSINALTIDVGGVAGTDLTDAKLENFYQKLLTMCDGILIARDQTAIDAVVLADLDGDGFPREAGVKPSFERFVENKTNEINTELTHFDLDQEQKDIIRNWKGTYIRNVIQSNLTSIRQELQHIETTKQAAIEKAQQKYDTEIEKSRSEINDKYDKKITGLEGTQRKINQAITKENEELTKRTTELQQAINKKRIENTTRRNELVGADGTGGINAPLQREIDTLNTQITAKKGQITEILRDFTSNILKFKIEKLKIEGKEGQYAVLNEVIRLDKDGNLLNSTDETMDVKLDQKIEETKKEIQEAGLGLTLAGADIKFRAVAGVDDYTEGKIEVYNKDAISIKVADNVKLPNEIINFKGKKVQIYSDIWTVVYNEFGTLVFFQSKQNGQEIVFEKGKGLSVDEKIIDSNFEMNPANFDKDSKQEAIKKLTELKNELNLEGLNPEGFNKIKEKYKLNSDLNENLQNPYLAKNVDVGGGEQKNPYNTLKSTTLANKDNLTSEIDAVIRELSKAVEPTAKINFSNIYQIAQNQKNFELEKQIKKYQENKNNSLKEIFGNVNSIKFEGLEEDEALSEPPEIEDDENTILSKIKYRFNKLEDLINIQNELLQTEITEYDKLKGELEQIKNKDSKTEEEEEEQAEEEKQRELKESEVALRKTEKELNLLIRKQYELNNSYLEIQAVYNNDDELKKQLNSLSSEKINNVKQFTDKLEKGDFDSSGKVEVLRTKRKKQEEQVAKRNLIQQKRYEIHQHQQEKMAYYQQMEQQQRQAEFERMQADKEAEKNYVDSLSPEQKKEYYAEKERQKKAQEQTERDAIASRKQEIQEEKKRQEKEEEESRKREEKRQEEEEERRHQLALKKLEIAKSSTPSQSLPSAPIQSNIAPFIPFKEEPSQTPNIVGSGVGVAVIGGGFGMFFVLGPIGGGIIVGIGFVILGYNAKKALFDHPREKKQWDAQEEARERNRIPAIAAAASKSITPEPVISTTIPEEATTPYPKITLEAENPYKASIKSINTEPSLTLASDTRGNTRDPKGITDPVMRKMYEENLAKLYENHIQPINSEVKTNKTIAAAAG